MTQSHGTTRTPVLTASFLDRTARDLLDLFAAGKTTPGAGSAAALMGAVAGGLLQSVALYTIREAQKDESRSALRERAEAFLESARARCERLRRAVDEDAAAFDRYWRQGRLPEDLQRATEVPVEIAEDCAALAEMAIELYDQGFRNARGEARTAALTAVANGEAAVHVAGLNLKAAATASWADATRSAIDDLHRRLQEIRARIS